MDLKHLKQETNFHEKLCDKVEVKNSVLYVFSALCCCNPRCFLRNFFLRSHFSLLSLTKSKTLPNQVLPRADWYFYSCICSVWVGIARELKEKSRENLFNQELRHP